MKYFKGSRDLPFVRPQFRQVNSGANSFCNLRTPVWKELIAPCVLRPYQRFSPALIRLAQTKNRVRSLTLVSGTLSVTYV